MNNKRQYRFDKLVRSNIWPRMENEGVTINGQTLSNQEYIAKLKRKILEEAEEVAEAESREEITIELADVMEVIYAIAAANDISLEEIEQARLEKLQANGGFTAEHYIDYIEVSEDNSKVIEYMENKKRHYVNV